MRELSPNNLSTADPKRGSWSAPSDAKSLFRNILAASPSGSRFYPGPTLPATHKPLRMNTLVDPEEKIVGGRGGDTRSAASESVLASRRQTGLLPVIVDKTLAVCFRRLGAREFPDPKVPENAPEASK
jgi:hypothetical protein